MKKQLSVVRGQLSVGGELRVRHTEKQAAFFELARRLREAREQRKIEQLGDELGKLIFRAIEDPSDANGSAW